MSRAIAIGDIHGCSTALAALIEAIQVEASDTIIPLGDYVDRGVDSKGVLDQLIALSERCHLVPILGNHDEMMLHARDGRSDFQFWLNCAGDAALSSYGDTGRLDLIPRSHVRLLESCRPYFETDTHVFLHAIYKPEVPLAKLDDHTRRWLSLRDYVPPERHCSGKSVIVGHTPQGEVLDLVALPVLYVLSFGPATGLAKRGIISGERGGSATDAGVREPFCREVNAAGAPGAIRLRGGTYRRSWLAILSTARVRILR